MSNNLFKNVNPGFVVATFLQACSDERFQNCWMTADTWAKLIEAYYVCSIQFNNKQLNRAISNSKSLAQQMDTSLNNILGNYSIASKAGGMFQKKYMPGKSSVWCYYATTRGQCPTAPPKGRKWYNEMLCYIDLLLKQV